MSTVAEPVLRDGAKYKDPCMRGQGQMGMSQTQAKVMYSRVRLTETHDIRTTGETYYTHGGAAHRATMDAAVEETAPADTTLMETEPAPLGATMETLPGAAATRAPVCIDFEDRFVYSVPEGTNAPEAATRVTRVNGILTKNNPYVEPMARDGSKFVALG